MELDFAKICRACLNEGTMMPIFKVNVNKKLMACASVQVWPNDELPKQICNKCSAKLHISFLFKKQCEKSDAKLRQYLQQAAKQPDAPLAEPLVELHPSPPPHPVYIECGSMVEVHSEPEQKYSSLFDAPQVDYNLLAQHYNLPPATYPPGPPPAPQPDPLAAPSPEKPLACPTCGKSFPTASKLTRHLKTHSPNPPYKCKFCSKPFSHSGNYKIHLRMHTGERPFRCPTCGKGCRQAQDLEKHVRAHTGEKPYKCTFCPRGFSTSSNLIAHVRTHTGEKPYVCCVCQKGFCQSNELTKHMRTHTGEKSHVCDICQRGFNGSSTLIVHRRSHTGERPYTCAICEKSFSQSSCLSVHMRRHKGRVEEIGMGEGVEEHQGTPKEAVLKDLDES